MITVYCSECRVEDVEFGVKGSGFRILGVESRVWGVGFRAQGVGCRVTHADPRRGVPLRMLTHPGRLHPPRTLLGH